MVHLRAVLHVLKEHQLFAKYSKCDFLLTSVALRGHIIPCEGITINQKKRETVRNLPRPLTPTDIISLLGLARYYSRFI